MSLDPLYVLLGEVSVQVLCPFFNCFFFYLPGVESCEFFIYFGDQTLVFTDMSPKARNRKEWINKWDLMKLQNFCMVKENSIKMKREPTVWENTFANDTLDKGLIFKIYKELTWLHTSKTNNSIKKVGKGLEQTLLQGRHTEGPETCERMLSITSHQRDAN